MTRQGTQWLARFTSYNLTEPRKLATLLWPPGPDARIEIVPAWQLIKAGGSRPPAAWLDFDVEDIVRRRQVGRDEATLYGHPDAMVCAFCGCWELHACDGGCFWVAPELCSACCRRFDIDPVKRAGESPAGWEQQSLTKPIAAGGVR